MTQPVTGEQESPPQNCDVLPNFPSLFPSKDKGLASYPSALVHAISDASTSGSDENGSEDDSNEEMDNDVSDEVDDTTGIVTRTESVDVHILRPITGGTPTVEDVTILSNVPTSRIIRSYRNVMMAYTFTQTTTKDRKKIQSRRDGEVVRIKKHFLRVYLAETPLATAHFVPVSPTKRKREEVEKDDNMSAVVQRPQSIQRRVPSTWRDACHDAPHFRDETLPSLEEAARLFGYAQ